ncbi:hypothetical protein BISA_2216 [Bifidobacterium saguini DSM 23967]|uniref:Uncharacterized protein n=2 Tax=Bifidobacterium saguini TaxID=762210 RepID=A0A087D5P4_9BIFI|nr:Ish1 domain-containing protein [Bifidobacterium saguini]KFI90844.1 hypothetical protein BISA_2216 [Bifidobacterium saguini DSM 23967]QTB90741.1 hypothetical protein BSD967_10700 [Bifidobacterium saguini]
MIDSEDYTPEERRVMEMAQDLIDLYELDSGNGECYIQHDAKPDGDEQSNLYMTLEAPYHGTITVTVPAHSDESGLRAAIGEAFLDFDADEEFNKFWSPEFGRFNNLSPSVFLAMLEADQQYFEDLYVPMTRPRKEPPQRYGEGNGIIVEIRWTESDLRQWLEEHDWPVTEQNMGTMRDMISPRTLKDLSIEKGWEIIDSLVNEGQLSRDGHEAGPEASMQTYPAPAGLDPSDPLFGTDPASRSLPCL